MNKTMKITVAVLVVIVVASICTYANYHEAQSQKNLAETGVVKTVKIGAVFALSGAPAIYGQSSKEGFDLAIDKINQEGKIKLEVVYEDSQMDPKLSVTAIQKLINTDGVKYVVTLSSAEMQAMCPITDANNVVLLGTGSAPAITQKCGDYTFRNWPSDIYQGKELAEKIYSKGINKVAVLNINSEYGVGLKDEFIKNFKGTIAAAESINIKETDFKTILTKTKNFQPDAIVYMGYMEEGINFLKQKKEFGINIPVYASESLKDETLFTKINSEYLDKLHIIFLAPYEGSEASDYRTAFKARYNKDISIFSDYVYDNVRMLAEAISMCDDPNDSVCVKDNLYKIDYTGATGKIKYDQNGDIADKPFNFYKVENGQFVPENE